MLHAQNDPTIVDMLRTLHLDAEAYREALSGSLHRRVRTAPVIPAANRYPRSAARAELEAALQPWNRIPLGGERYGASS